MGFFNDPTTSAVFGESNARLQDATLKNPKAYTEAVLFETLRHLPRKKLKEFTTSQEAKIMVKESLISQEVLDRLAHEECDGSPDRCQYIGVFHMMKENDDPEWNELIAIRKREQEIMQDAFKKYAAQVEVPAQNAKTEIIDKYIPEYFRQDD